MKSPFVLATILVAFATGTSAGGTNVECLTFKEAAANAGLTSLVDFVRAVKGKENALPADVTDALAANYPVTEPLTIFAPINAAFESRKVKNAVADATPETIGTILSELLANHIVREELTVADVMEAINDAAPDPIDVTTALGKNLEGSLVGGEVTITPEGTDVMAKLVTTDIQTCSGVVHVIDSVLVPGPSNTEPSDNMNELTQGMDEAATSNDEPASTDESASEPSTECVPLAQAAQDALLTELVSAVQAVKDLPGAEDLVAAVTAEQPISEPITLLAPNNNAFEEISAVLATATPETVLSVLSNHILDQPLTSEDVTMAITDAAPDAAEIETALGTNLEATLVDDDVVITPEGTDIMAGLVSTDVRTCAGIIHVINKVLVPAMEEDQSAQPIEEPETASEMGQCVPLRQAALDAGLTELTVAVNAVRDLPGAEDLIAAMSADEPISEPITLLAPQDSAFEAISEALATATPETILSVLSNHILGQPLTSEDVAMAITDAAPDAAEIETALGKNLEVTLVDDDVIISPEGTAIAAGLVSTDVRTCAGIVHVINEVLVPAMDSQGEQLPASAQGTEDGQDVMPETLSSVVAKQKDELRGKVAEAVEEKKEELREKVAAAVEKRNELRAKAAEAVEEKKAELRAAVEEKKEELRGKVASAVEKKKQELRAKVAAAAVNLATQKQQVNVRAVLLWRKRLARFMKVVDRRRFSLRGRVGRWWREKRGRRARSGHVSHRKIRIYEEN